MWRHVPPLLFVLAACSKPSTSSSSSASDATAGVADAGTSPVAVSNAEVTKLLDAWLAAQNTSAFAQYEALYAPRFEGVRRSGTQTAKLDRARWMKERAAMFKQKMTVAMKDVVISNATKDSATARFTQTWANDTYRDEGPKQMVLVRTGTELKIAREELLSSMVTPPGTVPLERFAFALDADGTHLVLSEKPSDAWARGAAKTVTLKGVTTTRKAVDESKLPAELSGWKGKKVELFGAAGVVCEGTIGDFAMLGRVTPHFGTINRWTGTGDNQGEPVPPAGQIASEAWDLSTDGGRVLTGVVRPEKGDCAKALWGRVARSESVAIAEAKVADPPTKALMLAEIRKTKGYADLQKSYVAEKEPKAPARWEDFDSKVSALVFDHPSGSRVVTLSISSGTGCGTFGGSLGQTWLQKDATTLIPLRDADGDELAPLTAADVDGDGQVDLISKEAILSSKGSKLTPAHRLNVPFLDCGC